MGLKYRGQESEKYKRKSFISIEKKARQAKLMVLINGLSSKILNIKRLTKYE